MSSTVQLINSNQLKSICVLPHGYHVRNVKRQVSCDVIMIAPTFVPSHGIPPFYPLSLCSQPANMLPLPIPPISNSAQLPVARCSFGSEQQQPYTPTMRYDDWDVILFPRDSHVPIQEFKTACFVSQADCELRCLPVDFELNCTDMP